MNPIDFETAKETWIAMSEPLTMKLPVSRLQRDLTIQQFLELLSSFGTFIDCYIISLKGLNKLLLNDQALNDDLEANWAVVAEAIQSVLRREG